MSDPATLITDAAMGLKTTLPSDVGFILILWNQDGDTSAASAVNVEGMKSVLRACLDQVEQDGRPSRTITIS